MKLLTANKAFQALKDNKEVEYKFSNSKDWKTFNDSCAINILLKEGIQFRLVQEIITIEDVSFPKPEVNIPNKGTPYYFISMSYNECIGTYTWIDDDTDLTLLKRGMLHLTKENAIAHAKALIKLSGGICE